MPFLFEYIVKLSISLSVVYLFYQLVLQKLTFYNWNRYYLLGYSLLSFLIPFVNISFAFEKNETVRNSVFLFIPSIGIESTENNTLAVNAGSSWSIWSWMLLLFAAGAALFLFLFCIRYISFLKIRRQATLLSSGDLKLYQVNKNIIPFSFGNSIFINQQLHREEELQEIIRHEFVHVKQKHTIDILCAELLCILNWYNPFAWLLRKAIRQNLEFIADNKVVENGFDKKQYQYLLLKVIGNNHFSIAQKFNFSSLKKRIAMMNKMRSAKLHLIKFLFILPLGAVILLAFRREIPANKKIDELHVKFASIVYDKASQLPISGVTITDENSATTVVSDNKGYFEMTFPIEEKTEIKFNLKKEGYYSFSSAHILGKKYTPKSIGIVSLWGMEKGDEAQPCQGCRPATFLEYAENTDVGVNEASGILKRYIVDKKDISPNEIKDTVPPVPINSKGYYIDIIGVQSNCIVIVRDKDRKEVERVLLTKWDEKKEKYEDLYGEILVPPPPPPPPPIAPHPPVPPKVIHLPKNVSNIKINNNQVVVKLKNGNTENYDFNNEKEKAEYEKKYGELLPPPPPPPLELLEPLEPVSSMNNISVTVKPTVVVTKINTVVKTTTFVSPSVTEPVRVVTKVDAPVSVKVTDAFPVKVQTTVKPVKVIRVD